ncbi:unnamed protein product [Clonostachys solani]|uniref:CHAT domain-containing protein n=1 Tax=Clonostachys solani TaxID=160281 RepID=A0A9N9W7I5_9HYPO|nr:unnamed protein product [Clonostachys solani]
MDATARRLADLEEAIRLGRSAVQETPKGHPRRPLNLDDLAMLLSERFSISDLTADLDEALNLTQEALDATPTGHTNRPLYLSNLAGLFNEKFCHLNSATYLEKAILLQQEAVNCLPPESDDRFCDLGRLGQLLDEKYKQTGAETDLNRTILIFKECVSISSEDSEYEDRFHAFYRLECLLHERFLKQNQVSDLEELIQLIQTFFAKDRETHVIWVEHFAFLSGLLEEMYSRTGSERCIEEAISFLQEAIEASPQSQKDHAGYLNKLALLFGTKYSIYKLPTDLEEAIRLHREAVQNADIPDALYVNSLHDLAVSLSLRYSVSQTEFDISEAIQMERQAVMKTAKHEPQWEIYAKALMKMVSARYIQLQDLADLEETIQLGFDLVRTLPKTHTSYWECMGTLLPHFFNRYRKTGSVAGLEENICLLQDSLETWSDYDAQRLWYLERLICLYLVKFEVYQVMDDLEEAIKISHLACETASNGEEINSEPQWRMHISLLNMKLEQSGTPIDLEEAIAASRSAIEAMPKGDHSEWLWSLDILGNLYQELYEKTYSMDDLDESIRLGRQTVKEASETHPLRAIFCNNCSGHLCRRFDATGSFPDIEEAIELQKEALRLTPQDAEHRVGILANHRHALQARYSQTDVLSDLVDGISYGRECLNKALETDPGRLKHLVSMIPLLNAKYIRMGSMNDFEEAMGLGQNALQILATSDPLRASCLQHLSHLLGSKYFKMGSCQDIDEAIRLATLLLGRYRRTRTVIDVEDAIRIKKEALSVTPKDQLGYAACLAGLGEALGERFQITDLVETLEKAIEVTEDAIKSGGDYIWCWQSLGVLRGKRYLRLGDITDLEEAIRLGNKVIKSTPEYYPDRSRTLLELAQRLNERYAHTFSISDLDDAIKLAREAMHITLEGHPDQIWISGFLGALLGQKSTRNGSVDDLESAIEFSQRAVSEPAETTQDQSMWYNSLGILFTHKYKRSASIEDIDQAIQFCKQAVNVIQQDRPEYVAYLNNLGGSLHARYLDTGSVSNLHEAIGVSQNALDVTPGNHPDRGLWAQTLGIMLYSRFMEGKSKVDLQGALENHQYCLGHSYLSVRHRIRSGRNVVRMLTDSEDWQQAYTAAQTSISLIGKLLFRHIINSDRLAILGEIQSIALDAAAAAANADMDPYVILSFLEQGRSMLASALQDFRINLSELEEDHPKLAKKFASLRDELDRSTTHTGFQTIPEAAWDAQSLRLYEAGKEFEELVAEIRGKVGLEDFLLVPDMKKMQEAAKSGPVVIINVSEIRCDAVLIKQDKIQLLPLTELDSNQVGFYAEQGRYGSSEVLEWLWDTIANPVLGALGFDSVPSGSDWPHVWWIPTGALSLLPIHAAGYHSRDNSETVLDRVISSYSSSVKAILHGRDQLPPRFTSSQKAVLVAMEDTHGHSKLPFAAKEVAGLHDLCRSMGLEPIEPPRRKNDVLSELLDCKIFHFAGHGYIDRTDPSKSTLILDDARSDPLTVATLLETNIRKQFPFLAYLSACSTGRNESESLSDEGIHLINGCQVSGFRHVIGTLWEVNDELCVNIAKITYEAMKDGGLSDKSVAQGLHNAVRSVRDEWLQKHEMHGNRASLIQKQNTMSGDEISHLEDRDQVKKDRLPRDVVPCDADKNMGSLQWVPYMHFGV